MSKNNIKLLTYNERMWLNERYLFCYNSEKDEVIVKTQNYKRETIHDAKEKFFINSKIRKITFTVEAIQIWKELVDRGYGYTLVDVQCIINELYVLYQEVTTETVLKLLKKEIYKEREGNQTHETN